MYTLAEGILFQSEACNAFSQVLQRCEGDIFRQIQHTDRSSHVRLSVRSSNVRLSDSYEN